PKTLPSTVSMLTSLYPAWSGVETNRGVLSDEALTLAEVLHDAGFATAAWTTNGNLVRANGVAQGFDRFAFLPPPADAASLTDHALAEWSPEGADTGSRRFTWLHYIDPHGPYTPPGPDADRFVRDPYYDGSIGVRLRLDEHRRINWNQGLGGVPHYQRLPFLEDPRRRQRDFYVARYDAEIRYFDGELQRLLATLQERGRLADTVVVLTADHGEGMGEHGLYFEHGWFVYQDQVHVPWLIRLPGKPSARRVTTPVELVDLAPTLLEILGIEVPGSFQGRGLRPVLEGGDAPRRPIYSITPDSYPQRYAGVRLGPWKLIRTVDKAHHRRVSEHLFQLEEDPSEVQDRLAGEPEVAAGLRRILDAGPWNRPEGATVPGGERETLDPDSLDPEVRDSLRSLGYL
ncbi:MAG: sulfatase-like hydrolase/transferase, partial [Acidobacteria bacterium]|nr:sulfatase-like hydrolase/transferase [Acidobacteriota bacterium]